MGESKEEKSKGEAKGEEEEEEAAPAPPTSRVSVTLGGEEGKDQSCATFLIQGEDHTIGNALKEIISRYPETEMCGYNMPYPTEPEMLFRIQTKPGTDARVLLRRGLVDLRRLFQGFEAKFTQAHQDFRHQQPQAMEDD